MARAIAAFACLALMGAALAVGLSASARAGRLFDGHVVFVAPLPDDERLAFSLAEIERMRMLNPSTPIAFAMTESGIFQATAMQARANIVYTTAEFFGMHFFDFLEGREPAYGSNTVLLSELLAWRLFGGFGVVGAVVWHMDAPFAVSGVVGGSHHGYTAWLCASRQPALSASSFYLNLPAYTQVEASVMPRDMLSAAFRNPGDFLVLDVTGFLEAMGIRNRLLLYFAWLFALAWALALLARIAARAIDEERLRPFLPKAVPCALFAALSLFVIFTGATDFIYSLPNFSAGHYSFFGFLFGLVDQPEAFAMPPAVQSLLFYNLLCNIAFFGYLAGLVGLAFALWPLIYVRLVVA